MCACVCVCVRVYAVFMSVCNGHGVFYLTSNCFTSVGLLDLYMHLCVRLFRDRVTGRGTCLVQCVPANVLHDSDTHTHFNMHL